MSRVVLISAVAAHYRSLIYQLMDERLGCHFCFERCLSTIKVMDTSILNVVGNRICIIDYDIVIDDLGIRSLRSWRLLFIGKLLGKKIILWDHGWYGREGFLKKWIKRAYFGLAEGALIYGNYARNLMIKNGFDADKLHVIYNSLDYDQQLTLRHTIKTSDIYVSHFGNNNPVICFIGRLTPIKKLDQLVEALYILKEKGMDCNLIIIGDGSEYNNLISRVEVLNLHEQVWFYGACYDEKDNAELLYNADLCVAPGNIGLTAIHAMMFGCPCISHNDFPWQMPEFEAIRDGLTGTFFERNNVQSLADVIFNWFMIKSDKRQEVRNECYKEIDENWNPHKQIEIIKRVVNG